MKEAFDIIIVAGQSNAEGYGLGEAPAVTLPENTLYVLSDNAVEGYLNDGDGNSYLKINDAYEYSLTPVNRTPPCMKLYYSFAEEYVKRGLLKDGRKLLIVQAAVGGTGFSRPEWGTGNVLYNRLIRLVGHALELNEQNKVVAFLWHQGEHDAYENPHYGYYERYRNHYYNLRSFIESVFRELNARVPFAAGGFCDEWYYKNKKNCDAIARAIKDVCKDIGGAFVATRNLASNNQTVHNGDDIHFSAASQYILGKKYFKAIVNKL